MVWRSILHVVNVKLNPKLVTLDQSETVIISHQKTDVRYKYNSFLHVSIPTRTTQRELPEKQGT